MTMEPLKPEAQRQIISDFYQKNVAKGKPYTVKHFRAMGLKKTQIYRVMKLVDSGEAVDQKKGQGRPRLLTKLQETQVKSAINNKNGGQWGSLLYFPLIYIFTRLLWILLLDSVDLTYFYIIWWIYVIYNIFSLFRWISA